MVLIRVLANLLILQLSYAQKSSELVVGGDECNINEHRFLVALYDGTTRTFLCGGVLIHPEWVLTAKHCNRFRLYMYLGRHNHHIKFDDEQRRYPRRRYMYRCRNNFTDREKDIMLLKLDSPVNNSTHIAPLSLPSSPPSVGSVCRIMGWGISSATEDILPDVPHCANINLLDYTVCRAAYPAITVSGSLLCAGILEGDIDSCNQDSGGPLICNEQFHGIVSWGRYPCGQQHVPGLYANIFDHLHWIHSIMAGNESAACPP